MSVPRLGKNFSKKKGRREEGEGKRERGRRERRESGERGWKMGQDIFPDLWNCVFMVAWGVRCAGHEGHHWGEELGRTLVSSCFVPDSPFAASVFTG